ncbi:MAG TPA: DUF6250 domain-containing protein [Lacunisphaera sp.]|nr:DUF6250 domain-containing protein [Lacunisphaera sp.]
MKAFLLGLGLLSAAGAADLAGTPGALLYQDDFRHGLAGWSVEQQPGGSVVAKDGRLVINDAGGCTVWFRTPLDAPVLITYTAVVTSASRVSDLNCFWMASDPAHPDALLGPGRGRDGKFASYDGLRLYYVGYGGNTNTTTRFRRYDGAGGRPLLPEHDLTAPPFLLQADHPYRLALVGTTDGHVQYARDGQVIFDWHDPAPLRHGWFGFRTVHSRIEISNFEVHALVTAPPGAR